MRTLQAVRLLALAAACVIAAPIACGGKVISQGGGSAGESGSGGSGGTVGGSDGSGGSGGAVGGSDGSGGSGGAVGGSGGSGGAVGGSGGSGGATGGSGGSGGSPTGGSGGSGGGSTGACVDWSSGAFDTSCNRNADCVEITPGPICDGYCACGGATINRVSKPAYEAAIKSIVPAELCGCPLFGNPTCVMGECKNCFGSPPVCK